jgi:hydroxymethylbilane synthase
MADSKTIRIGTRGSLLARTQTQWVVDRLRQAGLEVEIETISTVGDLRTDLPISGIVGQEGPGGDGVFVRELERAVRDGRVDAAVHSFKDMPTAIAAGLEVACVPERALAFDVMVGPAGSTLATLPIGAVVGTSSIRRVVQLRAARPDLVVKPIRGNVDTRLRKLDAGEYDCLILAGAGLQRLGLASRITEVLRPPAFWPAIAQGALAIEIRAGDARLRQALQGLDDAASHAAVRAERACLAALAGGCLAPIGGWARLEGGRLTLGACVLEDTTAGVVSLVCEEQAAVQQPGGDVSPPVSPENLGHRVAEKLLAGGADRMLARMRDAAVLPVTLKGGGR